MIQLTRLNGHSMAVNSDLIKFVEQAPDTVITLITGEKVVRRAVLAAATANCVPLSSDSGHQAPSK